MITIEIEAVRYRVHFGNSGTRTRASIDLGLPRHSQSIDGDSEKDASKKLAKLVGGQVKQGWRRYSNQ